MTSIFESDTEVMTNIICNSCGRTAVTINLERGKDKKYFLNLNGFLGKMEHVIINNLELTPESYKKICIRLRTNPSVVRSMDADAFGFVCSKCNKVYCQKCWTHVYETFDEGFYDDTHGECPEGHEQMIQD